MRPSCTPRYNWVLCSPSASQGFFRVHVWAMCECKGGESISCPTCCPSYEELGGRKCDKLGFLLCGSSVRGRVDGMHKDASRVFHSLYAALKLSYFQSAYRTR